MGPMAEPDATILRLPIRPPVVGAPPRYAERRGTDRREEDRLAREEATLLARVLDILAGDASAERRLAGVLDLLAATAGARRAAVLSGDPERRVAVTAETTAGLADPAGAVELAAWLDAHAPRSRAERAASGPAAVTMVRGRTEAARPLAVTADSGRAPDARFASLDIPVAGRVTLGFEMDDEDGVLALAHRLPPTLARHAAVALALVTGQLAASAELEALRAHESERERFVSTVAHDLRSPLTGLSGYLDLILEDRVGDPAIVGEFLERSRQIVESMTDLVGDLLEISKLDAGNLRLEIAPFSVAEVAGRAVVALAPIALDRQVELRTDLPPRMRAAVGDRRHVERIVTNLLANALKFGGQGGTVEVAGRFDGPVAVLAVRDDGPGIEAGRPVPDLRAVLPDRRPRRDRRNGPRAGDRPRPGPGDARRPGPGVRAGQRFELRPGPARTDRLRSGHDRGDPRASGRRRGGPTRGGRRPPGDPRLGSGTGSPWTVSPGERGAGRGGGRSGARPTSAPLDRRIAVDRRGTGARLTEPTARPARPDRSSTSRAPIR